MLICAHARAGLTHKHVRARTAIELMFVDAVQVPYPIPSTLAHDDPHRRSRSGSDPIETWARTRCGGRHDVVVRRRVRAWAGTPGTTFARAPTSRRTGTP